MRSWRSGSSAVHARLFAIIIEVSEVMHIASRDSTRVPLASDRAATSRGGATARHVVTWTQVALTHSRATLSSSRQLRLTCCVVVDVGIDKLIHA